METNNLLDILTIIKFLYNKQNLQTSSFCLCCAICWWNLQFELYPTDFSFEKKTYIYLFLNSALMTLRYNMSVTVCT